MDASVFRIGWRGIVQSSSGCETIVRYWMRICWEMAKFRCFNKRFSKIFFMGNFIFVASLIHKFFFSIAGTFRITPTSIVWRPTVCSSVLVSTLRDIID